MMKRHLTLDGYRTSIIWFLIDLWHLKIRPSRISLFSLTFHNLLCTSFFLNTLILSKVFLINKISKQSLSVTLFNTIFTRRDFYFSLYVILCVYLRIREAINISLLRKKNDDGICFLAVLFVVAASNFYIMITSLRQYFRIALYIAFILIVLQNCRKPVYLSSNKVIPMI